MTGITLASPVAAVFGSRSKADKDKVVALEKNGLRTVGDLLHRFPRTYLTTGELTELSGLREGQVLVVVGEVAAAEVKSFTNRRTGRLAFRVEAAVRTNGPTLQLTMFAPNQGMAESFRKRLTLGARGVFFGKATQFNRTWQLTNPTMVMLTGEDDARSDSALELARLQGLFPIYRETGKVRTWDIARVVAFALAVVEDVPDALPEPVREAHDLVDVGTALRWIHTPDSWGQVQRAQRRFRFEEALVTQLVLARRRAELRGRGAHARTGGGGLLAEFDRRLPFALTAGQREVGARIEADLAQPHPMNRLLQGEVGSGKTLVALRAMLRVVDSGGQAALLAPTEVLAQQHHRSITAIMGDLAAGGMLGGAEESTRVVLLTGSTPRQQRQEALLAMTTGEAGIVIGTHALIQEGVEFADLGLVVVDEQHRFGVEQRAALTGKAASPPHLLVMTATPIPRTVAMTVFGDLETSTLRELPAGRAAIQTTVVPLAEQPRWIDRVWSRVREEVAAGHQVYVVCPRISGDVEEEGQVDQLEVDEDGEVVSSVREGVLAAVEEVAPELEAGALAGLRVAMLHGRMAPEDKDATMRRFAAGEIDVLVSTTVIEVGVDVANATTMVLLDADRFGVSQLHQLRGRVGRGGLPGLCLLVSHAEAGSDARHRLEAVAATTDGFELSRVDLEARREGDVLGRGQSGFRTGLVHLKVLRDEDTIVAARAEAEQLLDAAPDLASYPSLRRVVEDLELDERADFMERS